MTISSPHQQDRFTPDQDDTLLESVPTVIPSHRHRDTDTDTDTDTDGDVAACGKSAGGGPVLGTRTKRQRRQNRRVERLTAVRELHTDLAPGDAGRSVVVRPPKGVGRHARNLWRTLEAQRVRDQLGGSRWVRNPPRWLGSRGRREFLQAERAAVKARMHRDAAPGGAYTAQEQQRGALVLALLLTLIPLVYLLSSCGA